MKFSKLNNESPKEIGNLRNFDLSVEEIKLLRTIKDLTQSLEDIERNSTDPARTEFYRNEIKRLEELLEDIRENTLI